MTTSPRSHAQELTTCIRILDDWSVDVDKLREAESRLGENEDHLRNLEAEQSVDAGIDPPLAAVHREGPLPDQGNDHLHDEPGRSG